MAGKKRQPEVVLYQRIDMKLRLKFYSFDSYIWINLCVWLISRLKGGSWEQHVVNGNCYTEWPPNQFIQGHVNIGKENIIFPMLWASFAQLGFTKRSKGFSLYYTFFNNTQRFCNLKFSHYFDTDWSKIQSTFLFL